MENKAGFWQRGGRRIEADDMFYRDEECLLWDRHASWLGCERLMDRERMSILQTVATSRAHHAGFFFFFSQFRHSFPRWPLKHSLPPTSCLTHASIPAYFSFLNSKDSYLPCRKPDRRKGETPGLQIWAQSGICPSQRSSTGFSVRNIRGRQIISHTFPKDVVVFTW